MGLSCNLSLYVSIIQQIVSHLSSIKDKLIWVLVLFNIFSFLLQLFFMRDRGAATCTQQYCWGTQQTVNGRKCPSAKTLSRKNLLPESSRKTLFSENFQKNLIPEEDDVIPEELQNTFRKNMFRNVSGRRFFRKTTFFFRKKGLPEIVFFF